MAAPLVRPVVRADYDQWLPLWDGYNAFYGRQGATALDPAITATTWERFFNDGEPVRALVAEQGSRLVGLTHYIFHRSTTAIAPICYLQDLFTSEAARGHGVGRALIEGVYARTGSRRLARLLASARDQPDRNAALRPHRRTLRLSGVPQTALI
ncbi:MAG: putative acetyltransferase [Sphingomonas bacterium]|uniref:GNAT family N-acetyltransferase n=1 Tax=Sphingomonas bacterium TaxID=1895847 RepID=UPI002616B52A|nr:GNAT family N-acetyltransferase [Sphingomonas bacterium]MDB5710984.1 putative acetyltransferase [Sphingomonas bacterium]